MLNKRLQELLSQYPLYKSGGSYFIDFPPLPGEEEGRNHVEIYEYDHCEWCWLNEEEHSGPWSSLKEAEGSAREIYALKLKELQVTEFSHPA